MKIANAAVIVSLCTIMSFMESHAAILYSTVGSTYTQNFDSLPLDAPDNASIESVYPNGWRDDSTTVAGSHVGLPGWYLYHPMIPVAENGDNDHQRLRFGDGSSSVGAFYAFSNGPNAATNPEKALGMLPADELALPPTTATRAMSMRIGLRLINNTGVALKEVYVTYDGEQWRDGAVVPIRTDYMYLYVGVQSTVDNWFSSAPYYNTFVPGHFNAPVSANANAAVDGNGIGKVAGINGIYGTPSPIGVVDWLPGEELWIVWDQENREGAGDGLAIDNVSVTAFVPEPTAWTLLALAALVLPTARGSRQ
jgi:hypothetical protein